MLKTKIHVLFSRENTFYTAGFFLIACLAAFLHFYKLSEIPYGIHVDEVALGYNALGLSRYGVTRYLESFPVLPSNFDGSQSALYTYLVAGLIRLFGFSIFILRLPGALFAIVTIFCGTLIIKERFGKKTALMGAALLTIMPYFIMQSRFGLDCNLLLGAVTASLYVLLRAVKTGKTAWFIAAGACFGLSLYAYALSYFIMPLFLFLTLVYLFYIKRIRFRQALLMGASLLAIGWPLMVFVYINIFELNTLQLGPFTILNQGGEFRGSEIGFDNAAVNFRDFFYNSFFRDWTDYNAFDYHYTLYIVSIPFALLGLVFVVHSVCKSLKSRAYTEDAPVLALLISVFCLAICLEKHGVVINRLNAMYFCWAYLTVFGIHRLYELIKRPKVFLGALAALYAISFFAFAKYYFVDYPTGFYPQMFFYPDLRPVHEEVERMRVGDAQIYYMTPYGHLYYALAAEVSPFEANFTSDEALAGFASIGNVHFFQPAMPDADSIYIVWEAQEEFVGLMRDIGFTGKYVGGYYIFTYET